MVSTQRDLTTGEAARIMRCSQQTVIRACDTGLLQSYKLPGSKFRRIEKQALLEFMEQNGMPIGLEINEQAKSA